MNIRMSKTHDSRTPSITAAEMRKFLVGVPGEATLRFAQNQGDRGSLGTVSVSVMWMETDEEGDNDE